MDRHRLKTNTAAVLRGNPESGKTLVDPSRICRAEQDWHPALRSLHAGYASPSWLRLPPSPATGHGQPLAATSIGTRAGLGLDDVRTQTAQSDGGRAVIKPSPPRMISPVSLDRPRIVARSSPITHES